MNKLVLSLFFAGTLALVTSTAIADGGRPVMVGGEADLDACGGVGIVQGLNPAGDNFLAVRTGPGSHHEMIDKLFTNNQVFMCDEDGSWIGIVYSRDDQDCGVGTPIAQRQPYSGLCLSGWVYRRYIKLIAG